MKFEPVRVASIGLGWWSDVLAEAVQRTSKLEVASCYTRTKEKRLAFAKKFNCKPADSFEEILKDPSIDAVIVTTPNHIHKESVIAAAQAGKQSEKRKKAPSAFVRNIHMEILY